MPNKMFRLSNRKKNVIYGFAFQMFSMLILGLKHIALVPLFIATFSTSDYASFIAIQGLTNLFYLFDPGFGDYFKQRIATAYGEDDFDTVELERRKLVGFQLRLVLGVLLIGAFISYFPGLMGFFRIDYHSPLVHSAFNLSVIGVALFMLGSTYGTFNVSVLMAQYVSAFGVLGNVVAITVTVLLYKHIGIVAIALGNVCFSITVLALNFYNFKKSRFWGRRIESPVKFDLSGILKGGFFKVLGARIARIAMLSTDSILILKFFGNEQLLQYDFTKRLLVFGSSFFDRLANLLVAPIASRQKDSRTGVIHFKLASVGMLAALGILLVGVFLNPIFIPMWVGGTFQLDTLPNLFITIYFACVLYCKWDLNLEFARGRFGFCFQVYSCLLILTLAGRILPASLDGFLLAQAIIFAFCAVGLYGINISKVGYSKFKAPTL